MFQFLHPEVLWALTALLLPIIIHLFNFKRYKKIFFSNLKFLSNLSTENKKRSNLKKWIILLLRLLALACIIIAFAQPYISTEINKKLSQSESFSIYIDNSFSMNAETEQGIALDVAKNKAFQLINSFPKHSKIRIYSNQLSISSPSLNKEQAITKTQEISPSPVIAKLSDKLRTINIDKKEENVRVYIFSDFQKNQSDFKNIKIDSSARITLLPLSIQRTSNLVVDSCWFEKPFHQLNQAEELFVSIKNVSNTDFAKIPIKLSINKATKSEISFDIKKNSSKILKLKYYNREAGIHNGKIELDDYPISYDNSLFFSYYINKENNILSINQDGPNKYLNKLFTGSETFKLTNKSKAYLFNENTDAYQLIILNEIDKMESGFRHVLTKYIENGGRILLIPNEKIDESVNLFLKDIEAPILKETDTSAQKLAKIELNSEIYKNVFEKLKNNARLPDIFKHYKLESSKNQFGEKLLQTKGNAPILTKIPYGNGQLYLFTTQLNPKWTNLITHPIIIPTLINLTRNSGKSASLYHQIGYPKAIKIKPNQKNKDQLHIVNNDLKIDFIPEQANHFEKGIVLFPKEQITIAENYLISLNDSILNSCSYNYSRLESVPEYYSENEINDLIEDHLNKISISFPNKMKLSELYNEQSNGEQYWKLFVILCIFFIISETIIVKAKL